MDVLGDGRHLHLLSVPRNELRHRTPFPWRNAQATPQVHPFADPSNDDRARSSAKSL
jgi:hypothetical protein